MLKKYLVTTLRRILGIRRPVPTLDVRSKRHPIMELSAHDVFDALASAQGGHTSKLFGIAAQVIADNSHAQTEFGKRKLAVLGGEPTISPRDAKNPQDVAAAKFCEAWAEDSPDFLNALIALMDGVLYPEAILAYWFEAGGQDHRYTLRLEQVDPELFDYSTGKLMISETDDLGNQTGTLLEVSPDLYIRHCGHLLSPKTQPANWGGPIRSILGWHLYATTSPEWWSQFLERLGAPFLVATADPADEASKYNLEAAFAQATRLFGIVASEGTDIKMLSANSQGTGDAHLILHDKCCREISKLIQGQTSGADVQKTGGLNGSTDLHEQVRNDLRQWDEKCLAKTVRLYIFKPLLEANGITGAVPNIRWSPDPDETDTLLKTLDTLPKAGLELDDTGVEQTRERLSLGIRRASAPPPPDPSAPGMALSAETQSLLDMNQLNTFDSDAFLSLLQRAANAALTNKPLD